MAMKRSGFKRPEYRPARKPLSKPAAWRQPEPVADVVTSAPKRVAYRDRALLDLAKGQPCLLRVPGVCDGGGSTTVACHSNAGVDGKAGGQKADDFASVWGCYRCHCWLDQGGASREEKEKAFAAAMRLQAKAWRDIASGVIAASERSRASASRALAALTASGRGRDEGA